MHIEYVNLGNYRMTSVMLKEQFTKNKNKIVVIYSSIMKEIEIFMWSIFKNSNAVDGGNKIAFVIGCKAWEFWKYSKLEN